MPFKVGDRVRIEYSGDRPIMRRFSGKNATVCSVLSYELYVHLQIDGEPGIHCISTQFVQKIPIVNVGDRVRCVVPIIQFIGRDLPHRNGEEFEVAENTRAYYQWAIERGDYILLPRPAKYRVHMGSYGSLTGKIFQTLRYDTLAAAIVQAHFHVDERGWNQATVAADIEGASPMLFGAFRRSSGGIECIKTADCNVTTAEIHAALQEMLKGD